MLRELATVNYCPILALRPAEMNAVNELPSHIKTEVFPVFLLQPWLSSKELINSIEKIETAYPERPYMLDINYNYHNKGDRPAYQQLLTLQNSAGGYRNWCEFVAAQANVVPVIQIRDLGQLESQLKFFVELDRGIVFRFSTSLFSSVWQVLSLVATFRKPDGSPLVSPADVCVIFDHEKVTRDVLSLVTLTKGYIADCHGIMPTANYVVSASSFPDQFEGLSKQDIFERTYYNLLSEALPYVRLIYSDRGSARAEALNGGGGLPIPRIDYPKREEWRFYRQKYEDHVDKDVAKSRKNAAYKAIANYLIKDSSVWDAELRIWGTQMIEATAAGEDFCIDSAAKATAVRINLHLHNQNAYSKPRQVLLQTDEEYVD